MPSSSKSKRSTSSTKKRTPPKSSSPPALVEKRAKRSPKKSEFSILTWNVNGLRAWSSKPNTIDWILEESNAEIVCLQETKVDGEKKPLREYLYEASPAFVEAFPHIYSTESAEKKGYSGTAILSKTKPLKRLKGLSNDFEGRVLSLKFEQFVLVCVYVPNSGLGLKRLSHRQQWNLKFEEYLNDLRSESPNLIVCGDLNVAHTEIDLAHPKTNTKTAGFTVEERTDFSRLLEKCQLIDGFRNLYPEQKEAYTFWSYKRNARASNAGWRLDYFLLPETTNQLKDCVIHSDVLGSDHCPVELIITI